LGWRGRGRDEGAGQEGVLVSLIAFPEGLGLAFSLTLWVADVSVCTPMEFDMSNHVVNT